jgi:hypothetical protein
MRNIFEQKALSKIQTLTQAQFESLALKTMKDSSWQYVGSNSKSDGDDAHWMRFSNGSFESITSSTYGNGQEYYLVQETNMDLDTLKKVSQSVISSGDATSGGDHDPDTDEGLAQIINGIAFNLPGHGGENEIVTNPQISQESERLNIPVGDRLINTLFAEVADRYDIPFKA